MFEPSIPAHCEPTNDFLLRFSATFHTCIPTPLAFISSTLGVFSIIAWLFSQLPQIYKNWSISSTSGLSLFFLVQWGLGDLSNVLGAIFTHQASWQVAIGSYYVFVDLCLVSQWMWYEKLRHGNETRTVARKWRRQSDDWPDSGMHEIVTEGIFQPPPLNHSSHEQRQAPSEMSNGNPSEYGKPQIIFRAPNFAQAEAAENETPPASFSASRRGTTIHRARTSSPILSPSPRTILLVACLAAIVHGSPVSRLPDPLSKPSGITPTSLERAGTIFSWMSTGLYLGSRLPQLIKNWQRKSTAGLSPQLFAAAFCGNLFYSLALVTNPCAWFDFGPFGGGGWASVEGSIRVKWVSAALPFFLGAAGVLGLDASVGVQFLMYGESDGKVVVVEEQIGSGWRWRRVSGWMRGWIPSIGDGKSNERKALLGDSNQHGEVYRTL